MSFNFFFKIIPHESDVLAEFESRFALIVRVKCRFFDANFGSKDLAY